MNIMTKLTADYILFKVDSSQLKTRRFARLQTYLILTVCHFGPHAESVGYGFESMK